MREQEINQLNALNINLNMLIVITSLFKFGWGFFDNKKITATFFGEQEISQLNALNINLNILIVSTCLF